MLVEIQVENVVIEWTNWKHLNHSLSLAGIPELKDLNLLGRSDGTSCQVL
jgi:hypothetical protein